MIVMYLVDLVAVAALQGAALCWIVVAAVAAEVEIAVGLGWMYSVQH